MSENLVTVGTCTNTTEAAHLINRLAGAGIPASMADDYIVTADFLLGNAIGWIKVQVREEDVERTLTLLQVPLEPVPEDEIPWDEPNEEDAELPPEEVAQLVEERHRLPTPDAPPTAEELLVNRAYRVSILGLLLFPPLPHFFSLYLLLKVAFRECQLSPRDTIRFYAALLISLGMIAMGFLLWSYLFRGPLEVWDD